MQNLEKSARRASADARRAANDGLSLRAGYAPAFGDYVLDPDRKITLPKFAFSFSANVTKAPYGDLRLDVARLRRHRAVVTAATGRQAAA